MRVVRRGSLVAIAMLSALVLLVAAACLGDDPIQTATTVATESTAGSATGTTTDAEGSPEAESAAATMTAASEDAAASPTSPATAEPAATATATASAATATPATSPTTAAASPTAPATATTAATPTEAFEEDVFGDLNTLDPELLPNFTLTFSVEMTGIPDEEEDFGTVSIQIQQSATDNYHMNFDAGAEVIEFWLVDGVNYLRQEDGSVVPIPGGAEVSFFSPSMFLTIMPVLEPELKARRVGEETISGRATTHYRVDAADYLSASDLGEGDENIPTDARGVVDVWIDNELNIMIRQEADLTWTNADGTTGTMKSSYLIDQIGSTPRIEAPQ